ncbi:MAG: hypothetical protein HQL57_01630 [Magnetococcales bacterium]|nr:hypothetical protein [Magnetococcales bacterium]MBF0155870.1 hypothetical protein [Magnetococcales bacterium]
MSEQLITHEKLELLRKLPTVYKAVVKLIGVEDLTDTGKLSEEQLVRLNRLLGYYTHEPKSFPFQAS